MNGKETVSTHSSTSWSLSSFVLCIEQKSIVFTFSQYYVSYSHVEKNTESFWALVEHCDVGLEEAKHEWWRHWFLGRPSKRTRHAQKRGRGSIASRSSPHLKRLRHQLIQRRAHWMYNPFCTAIKMHKAVDKTENVFVIWVYKGKLRVILFLSFICFKTCVLLLLTCRLLKCTIP